MIVLRDYQQAVKDQVEYHWSQGVRNVCAVLPTGAGKSSIMSDMARTHNEPTIVIAHRQELVGQISQALARNGIYHKVIASNATVKFCVSQHMREFNRSYFHAKSKVAVAGVQTLIRRNDDLDNWAKSVTLWMMDECFPSGTEISMSDGSTKNIEDVQIGDDVLAFKESGEIYSKKVTRLFKNPTPQDMVRLKAGHHLVECTPEHPIFTNEGWKHARDITRRQTVFLLRSEDKTNFRIPKVHLEKDRKDLLHREEMWSKVKTQTTLEKATNQNILSLVRKNRNKSTLLAKKNRSYLLQQRVFNRVQTRGFIKNSEFNEQKVRFRTDEKEKPNDEKRNSSKSFKNIKGKETQATSTRWERQRSNPSGEKITRTIRRNRFHKPVYSENGAIATSVQISKSLQSGLCKPITKNRNRSRWRQSQFAKRSGSRSTKRWFLQSHRVDTVEIFKPSDIGRNTNGVRESHVYNLEVEGLHTYIANGIAVHNCHHLTRDNQWGSAVEMFPNAKGLGVTATPLRADGKGLGRHSDGVMDQMVVGPCMRDLQDRGFLSEYRIIAPPCDIKTDSLKVGSNGDYTAPSMTKAVRESHIVGDVVEQYLKYANGKLGVTFTTDVNTAKEIAMKFRSCDIPAECVSAKTPDAMRAQLIRDFAAGTIKQLVNVDLFGEGFDLPSIEVVSFARPTMSYGLFVQQFGRSLRPMEGKEHAIIIDHVNNTMRHGLPDYGRDWTLDRRERKSKGTPEDVIPTKICEECLMVYERIHRQCPFCQHVPVPVERSSPEVVDGDLFELDAETLARLRGARRTSKPDPDYMIATGMDKGKAYAIAKNWTSRTEAQNELSQSIAWWGAWQRQLGRSDSEAYRRFYLKYGMDVLSAQALPKSESEQLKARIDHDIDRMGQSSQHLAGSTS